MEKKVGKKASLLKSVNPYFPQLSFFFVVFWRCIDPRPADGE